MGNAGARLGLSVGFSLIGSYFGPTGAAIGGMIGGIIGSVAFPDKQPDVAAQGPRLEDLSVQTSTYGNAIPVIYGTVRVSGNVIWSTGLIEHVNTTVSEVAGGKGGSQPTSTITQYVYTCSFAVSLCQNEIVGIKRVWADDKLWYDFGDPPVGVNFAYELYTGTEDQVPCSAIEAHIGAGNVPAFRGQAYIVFKELDLTAFGNRVPNFHFEVVAKGTQAITAQFYQSPEGNYSWFTDIAIDTETGFIWAVHSQRNRVLVLTPDLTVVKTITAVDISQPMRIKYQPAYSYLDVPGPFELGAVPEVVEMPPRMFISAGGTAYSHIGMAMAYSIDCRTYQVHPLVDADGDGNPFELSTSHLIDVDMRTIHVEDINPELAATTLLVHGNFDANAITHTINDESGWGSAGLPSEWTTRVNSDFLGLANDTDFSDPTMTYGYVVFWDGLLWAVDENYAPVYEVDTTVGYAAQFNKVRWDKFERCVYVKVQRYADGSTDIVKYSETLGTEYWRVTRQNIYAFEDLAIHPQTGALYAMSKDFGGNWWLHELDKADGSYLSSYEIADTSSRIWTEMVIYPNSMFAMVAFVSGPTGGGGVAKVPLTPGPTATTTTLKQVVEDVSVRTGLTLSDINASALVADIVNGYSLASRMPARQAIEPLMAGYFFDAVESDHVVKFVKRGGASVKTISYLDTGGHRPESEPTARRDFTRLEENELPWQIDVNYMDVASFYKINTQYARRLIGASKTVLTANIAAVFTSTEARRIAEIMLYNSWTERQSAMMRLTCKNVELDPTDVITFQDEDLTSQVYRITRAEYTYPNQVQVELVEEDSTVYTGTATGVDADVPAQTLPTIAPTLVYFMDTTILGRELDNDVGYYFAGTPSYGTGWPGAGLYRSDDSGTSYVAVGDFGNEATAGIGNSVLGYEGSIP